MKSFRSNDGSVAPPDTVSQRIRKSIEEVFGRRKEIRGTRRPDAAARPRVFRAALHAAGGGLEADPVAEAVDSARLISTGQAPQHGSFRRPSPRNQAPQPRSPTATTAKQFRPVGANFRNLLNRRSNSVQAEEAEALRKISLARWIFPFSHSRALS